ncbi:MAG: TetR/AcrR family transcriptional regulator C-terminal domain-containing protein [Microbacteriaceae bacterium]
MTLTPERIVQEALALLDEDGLDGVTLRRLAARLGVQAPTLYWHVHNKADLLAHLGDAILAPLGALPDPAGAHWRDWLLEAATHFRASLLAHRDGARVVAAAQASPAMAAFSERAMSVLVSQDEPLRRARLVVLLIERFTIGLVLEEQSAAADPAADSLPDPSELTDRYPLVTAAITEYFADDATLDDLYRDSIRLILFSPIDGA